MNIVSRSRRGCCTFVLHVLDAANTLGSLFPGQERFQVALADQPTASRLHRPELAGTQQVVNELSRHAQQLSDLVKFLTTQSS